MGGVERLGPTALGMVGVFHGSGFRTCGLHVEPGIAGLGSAGLEFNIWKGLGL